MAAGYPRWASSARAASMAALFGPGQGVEEQQQVDRGGD